MEIEPLNIFMFMMRIAPVIVTIVIIATFFFLLQTEIKTDEVERASLEITENLFSSPELTAGKYVFDPDKLAQYDQSNAGRKTELSFLRTCSLGYFAEIENLQSGSKWEFGYNPTGLRGIKQNEIKIFLEGTIASGTSAHLATPSYIINKPERTFIASLQNKNPDRLSEFYGTVDQAKVTVTTINTWLTRSTCLVEKAFTLKERQEMEMPCMLINDAPPCGFSLQRHPNDQNLACNFQRDSIDVQNGRSGREHDCRYLPPEIKFQDIDLTFSEPPPEFKKKIVAYPIKEGESPPFGCADAKAGTITAGKNDDVQTVLLCTEDVK